MRQLRSKQDDDPDSRERATITTGLVLTVVAWFASRVVVGAAWGPARNPFTFTPGLWARWDSFNYLLISEKGTNLGTAGWLPGYPLLVRVVSWIGISQLDASLLVAWIALAVAMFLVWFGWARDLSPVRALLLLVLFGLFPGAVYNFALFPTSVALACTVGSVLAATRERFLIATLLMVVAGFCYPTAWFAAVGLTVGLIVIGLSVGPATVVRRAAWGLAGLASLLVLGIYDQITAGAFNGYFRIHSLTGASVGKALPGQKFLSMIILRDQPVQYFLGKFDGAVLAFQAVIALALAAAATIVAVRAWQRTRQSAAWVYPATIGLIVTVTLVFLNPNSGVWYRSVVLAAPCVTCLRKKSLPVLGAVVIVVGVTTALISRRFFTGSLV